MAEGAQAGGIEPDFSSPAVIDKDVDIALDGATTVVFVWRTDVDSFDDVPEFPFVLGDVRFTE